MEGVTKADFDRFTDQIENVLSDEKGRKFFKNFMCTTNMNDGRRVLDFWEHVESCLNFRGSTENISYRGYLKDVDHLIDEADKIEELNPVNVDRLNIARDSENQEEMVEALHNLKSDATKALRREYHAFKLNIEVPK